MNYECIRGEENVLKMQRVKDVTNNAKAESLKIRILIKLLYEHVLAKNYVPIIYCMVCNLIKLLFAMILSRYYAFYYK